MIFDANKDQPFYHTNFDLCIIGAGPAGITLAAELANTNIKICLLDAGDENYSLESQKLYKPQSQPEFYEDTMFNRLRMLGGSSNHWENNTSELMQNDFAKKAWVSNSGWPIKYEDVKPHYNKAAMYCQTDPDGYDSKKWHSKFDKTDPLASTNGMITGVGKASLPPTRFYEVHKAKLLEADNITVIKNANLIDIVADLEKQKIISASFQSYTRGQFEIFASKFVMAMGGIENARMLLIFNEKYDNKLGNNNDLVGRYFMDHPLIRAAKLYTEETKDMGLFDEQFIVGQKRLLPYMQHTNESIMKNRLVNLRMPIFKASRLQLSDGVESMHVLRDALEQREIPEHVFRHLLNAIKDADSVNESIYRKIFDNKILTYVDNIEGYEMQVMFEQLPHFDNRISLGNKVDSFGLKQHVVHWRFHDEDFELAWDSLKVAASQLALTGIGRLRVLEEFQNRLQNEKLYVSHHHMGTTRMGLDDKEGVVDKNCKVFNTQNLYIAGSSVFTTGGHVPPTLTIVALSVRLSEYFKSQRGL